MKDIYSMLDSNNEVNALENDNSLHDYFSDIDVEMNSIKNATGAAFEAINLLQKNIDLYKDAENITKKDILNINIAIEHACNLTGYDYDSLVIGNESGDLNNELIVSLEASKTIITKIIGAYKKTFARLNNTVLKYVSKFDTYLSSLFNNIDKDIEKVMELKNKNYSLPKEMLEDSFFKIKSAHYIGLIAIDGNDIYKTFNNIIDLYSDKKYIENFTNTIIDMMSKDGKIKQFYNSDMAVKILDTTLKSKIKKIVCKVDKNKRLVLGSTYNKFFILERCKRLHITGSFNPYSYTVNFGYFDIIGSEFNFNYSKVPSYDDMLQILNKSKEIDSNKKNVVDSIHNMLKIGSDFIEKIDEEANWENIGIYSALPEILTVLAKTYANLPIAIDSYTKVYINNVIEHNK